MRKNIKFILIISVVAVVVIFIIFLMNVIFNSLFIGGVIFGKFDYNKASEKFEKNKNELFIVKDYFFTLEFESIYIPMSMESNMMFVDEGKVVIENDKVVDAIKKLKMNGCNVIDKSNNTLLFQMWATLDEGRGVAYSLSDVPESSYITKLEKLGEANWYYYEEK